MTTADGDWVEVDIGEIETGEVSLEPITGPEADAFWIVEEALERLEQRLIDTPRERFMDVVCPVMFLSMEDYNRIKELIGSEMSNSDVLDWIADRPGLNDLMVRERIGIQLTIHWADETRQVNGVHIRMIRPRG